MLSTMVFANPGRLLWDAVEEPFVPGLPTLPLYFKRQAAKRQRAPHLSVPSASFDRSLAGPNDGETPSFERLVTTL